MERICNNCKTVSGEEKKETINVTVPYMVHEEMVARQERQIKRMWIALIVAVALMFLTNMMWVGVFINSYDYSSEEIIVEQDAQDGGNNNYIGNDGDINNGVSEDNNSQEEAD